MKAAISDRVLLRAAIQIHERLKTTSQDQVPMLPVAAWQDLAATHGRLKLAVERSWPGAARQLRNELRAAVYYLLRRLDECVPREPSFPEPASVCSAREIHQDLLALHEEFAAVRIDLEAHLVTVITEPVVLEDTNFGRFEIVLDYHAHDQDLPYIVLALDPNSASADSGVTHPHVRDEHLCEGNGRLAIRRALEQGRLLDFFVLVRQILETYNEDSAYVELSHWNGRDCPDCGRRTSEDDSTCCERCDSDLCLECSSSCPECGRSCCTECRMMCPECETDYCRECLAQCPGCSHDYCPKCLKTGLCQDCQLKENEPDDEDLEHNRIQTAVPNQTTASQTAASAPETQAALQPLCLGQALVPA